MQPFDRSRVHLSFKEQWEEFSSSRLVFKRIRSFHAGKKMSHIKVKNDYDGDLQGLVRSTWVLLRKRDLER